MNGPRDRDAIRAKDRAARQWPVNEPPIEHVKNALAILVAYGDGPVPPSAIPDVKARLWRAITLWETEALTREAEGEADSVARAQEWERDHPDDAA